MALCPGVAGVRIVCEPAKLLWARRGKGNLVETFVLVHGSWHDGSAWEPVIKRLESKGHRAFGPTIAGHGKGVDKVVSHAQSVQSIVDFIVRQDLTEVVLQRSARKPLGFSQGMNGPLTALGGILPVYRGAPGNDGGTGTSPVNAWGQTGTC